jgi:hypothetical protein
MPRWLEPFLRIMEVPGSDLYRETGYPDKNFVVPSVAAVNDGMVRGIRLQPLPSTSFPVHYSLIISSLDAA